MKIRETLNRVIERLQQLDPESRDLLAEVAECQEQLQQLLAERDRLRKRISDLEWQQSQGAFR